MLTSGSQWAPGCETQKRGADCCSLLCFGVCRETTVQDAVLPTVPGSLRMTSREHLVHTVGKAVAVKKRSEGSVRWLTTEGKLLATKHDEDLSLILWTRMWKERTDSHKLSSDLQVCAVTHV